MSLTLPNGVTRTAREFADQGGQTTIIIPTHDLVVVRLGHYKGEELATKSLARALELLLGAVPQARPAWKVPAPPQ